jgi:hypothetical protein
VKVNGFQSRHTALRLIGDQSLKAKERDGITSLSLRPPRSYGLIELRFDRGDTLIWPNREGERMALSSLDASLAALSPKRKSLSINYPSIASCRTLILESAQGDGLLIAAAPDPGARVTRFTLKSVDCTVPVLEILAPESLWAVCPFDGGIPGCRSALERIRGALPWPDVRHRAVPARFQVQVGLIDPQGNAAVPEDAGFMVLADIARVMGRMIGTGNVLHVFGYARGHDRGYPDYRPSARLGGERLLGSALESVHQQGQQAVFYLNPRIAEPEYLSESLLSSILTDSRGQPYREEYHGREFVVMNPGSEPWIEHILDQAQALAALGADGVQLDQVAGRNALAEPGEPWGGGYLRMIECIQALDLRVWIEGLSDLYPADWFEMTDRDPAVSKDGSIHSGHPLGNSAPELFALSVPKACCLIPFVNLQNIQKDLKINMIIDINKPKGGLFLYDADYLTTLASCLNRAIEIRSAFLESPRPRE